MKFLRSLTFLNAAELTVLSFIITSVIGGVALMVTEQNRIVVVEQPVHHEVRVIPVGITDPSEHVQLPTETHTTIKKIEQKGISFVDAWFTSVSALCVTGLTSVDFSQYTVAGQIITLLLIQMGGLGIIIFTTLFAFVVIRNLSERISVRKLLASLLDSEHHDVTDMLKYVFFYTLLFEGVGTIIMGAYLQWFVDPKLYGYINPWWWGLFHAISGFNNAGFSLMNNNISNFATDPVISLTIAFLIILGGLGYPVLIAIYAYMRHFILNGSDKQQQALANTVSGTASPIQVKVAILGTVLLLAIGTLVPLFVEWNNPVYASMNISGKLIGNFFQSASTRTAGFNSVDVGALHVVTIFLYIILMYIGANPAGTGGGIKIPTVAVLYGYIKDWFSAPGKPVVLMGEGISKFALSHAIRLFFFSMMYIVLVTLAMCYVERDYLITPDPIFNFTKIIFEIVSAFGTVGMTMGFPGGYSSFSTLLAPASKLLLIATMLLGRVGPLTLLASLPWKRTHADAPLSPDFEGAHKIQIG